MPDWKALAEKAAELEEQVRARHLFAGQILTLVVLPPEGREDWQTGNFESNALNTGQWLAALSFKYAVTGDPEAARQARETALALEHLQRVTGTDGFFARGFKRALAPSPDERWFFFWREWHQNGEYRWLGDPSSDSLDGIMHGYAVYWELVADAPERARVGREVDRLIGRVMRDGHRILDLDGKMTLWGNFNPWILEENINALEALSNLKAAAVMSGKQEYEREYQRLIREHDYAEKAALAKTLPHGSSPLYDDNLAHNALWALWRWEEDPKLREYYRASVERHWIGDQAEAFPYYQIACKHVLPEIEMNPAMWDWLARYEMPRRQVEVGGKSPESGPRQTVTVEGGSLDGPHNWLRTYWMGRWAGLIE